MATTTRKFSKAMLLEYVTRRTQDIETRCKFDSSTGTNQLTKRFQRESMTVEALIEAAVEYGRVEAFDERERVGDGSHTRVIVNVARFDERVQRKLTGDGRKT